MHTFILSRTCTFAETGGSTVIQKAFTLPRDRQGRWDSHEREGGLLSSKLVRTEAAGQTLLGCVLCG